MPESWVNVGSMFTTSFTQTYHTLTTLLNSLGEFMFVRIILYAITAIIIIAPVMMLFISLPPHTFWNGLYLELVSTSIALISGINIALYIDNHIKKKEQVAISEAERQQEKSILTLLNSELEQCVVDLNERLKTPSVNFPFPIKVSFWNSVMYSGKISYISNSALLAKLSTMYFEIKDLSKIEEVCFKACNVATVTYPDGTTAQKNLHERAVALYPTLLTHANETITLIKSHLR